MTATDNLAVRYWRRWILAFWLIAMIVMIAYRWQAIQGFALPDTDDNLRMSQVRALLAGQSWYDLRQYNLNPPLGFNIHWSRIVDIPIALIEIVVRPFFGLVIAEKAAAALAPMLPLGVVLAAMAVAVRRLVAPGAFAIAVGLVFLTNDALRMFLPMRVDHHGWQLACLVVTVAGLADHKSWRGGMTMGVSSAVSLTIGLELLPFLVICGAAAVLRWVWDANESTRLRFYGIALGGGTSLGYLGFGSYDNMAARCDALSPVWLSAMVMAGALAVALSFMRSERALVRLSAAAAGGAILALGFAIVWPHCLGRPEQVSPELDRLWLSNVREAKSILKQSWTVALGTAILPVIGVIGSGWAAWTARGTPRLAPWVAVVLVSLVSALLLLWQMRAGPAAQLMAIPGATALAWAIWPRLAWHRLMAVRTIGLIAAVLLMSGAGVLLALPLVPGPKQTEANRRINRANFLCPSLAAMRPVAQMPPTTIFTFVDLGPRLITLTDHQAVAGPYHRNGDAILDVHHAFGGSPENARAIMRSHGATLLMTCPNMSEATVHRARHKKGFYSRLGNGERFDWLTPVAMPKGSPLLVWKIS